MSEPLALPLVARHRLRNLIHTGVLLTALAGLLLLIGWSFAGVYGMIWAVAGGFVPLLFGTGIFPGLVLRMYGARHLSPADAPRLHAMVEELADRVELAVSPRLFFIPSDAPIVFSTGHGTRAAIALSAGVLRLLTLRELFGVLGHEISHIGNNDTWIMSLADSLTRVTRLISLTGQVLVLFNLPLVILSDHPLPWVPLLLMTVAPVVSALTQLALSRTREYDADLSAAQLTGDPEGLASALARLEGLHHGPSRWRRGAGHGTREPSFLRTHPDTGERIRRLVAMAQEMGARRWPPLPEGGTLHLPGFLDLSYSRPRRRWTGLWY